MVYWLKWNETLHPFYNILFYGMAQKLKWHFLTLTVFCFIRLHSRFIIWFEKSLLSLLALKVATQQKKMGMEQINHIHKFKQSFASLSNNWDIFSNSLMGRSSFVMNPMVVGIKIPWNKNWNLSYLGHTQTPWIVAQILLSNDVYCVLPTMSINKR